MKNQVPLILILLTASVYGLDLDVAYDPVTNQSTIGIIDDEGRFHRYYGADLELEVQDYVYIDEGASDERGELLRWDPAGGYYVQGKRWTWTTSGEPCPTNGPYELLLHWDQPTENWNVFVLDGAGQLYTVTKVSWNPKGEPVPGPPPYQLTSVSDPSMAGVFPVVLDGDGRTWLYIWLSGEWEPYPATGAYVGASPNDYIALTSREVAGYGKTIFALVDETGRILEHGEPGGDWVEYAALEGGEEPYHIAGFITSSADGYRVELKIIDNNGQFFLSQDGEFKAYGEPCTGTPPWDLTVYRGSSRGTHMILVADSTGALFVLGSDGEWKLLIRSFE